MDKETLERLLEGQPKAIRAQGVLLFNGVATCAQAYQTAPTSQALRDWEAAQAALAKFVQRISAAEGGDPDAPLANLAAVLDYLAVDWSVTKTSLYRHHKEGKIAPRGDGAYAIRDVDRYARTWLKQKSTGKRLTEKIEELQRKRLDLEIKNLELDHKRKEHAYGKDLERYVPKELMEIELAGRAGVLDAGLKHWVQSRAAEWIRAVGGDTGKVGDLILLMTRGLDDHINSYASTISYQVVIDAEEDDADSAAESPEIEEDQHEEEDKCRP